MPAVHSFFLLLFSSYFQSLCEVLAPGLAVSVLKAIFQEVHVQVSNGIFHPPISVSYSLCLGKVCQHSAPGQRSVSFSSNAVFLQNSEPAWLTAEQETEDR